MMCVIYVTAHSQRITALYKMFGQMFVEVL